MTSRTVQLIACVLMAVLLYAPSPIWAMAEEKIEETYPLAENGSILLKNISGNIVVRTWEKNEINIRAVKSSRHKKDLKDLTIDITRTDSTIRIVTQHHPSFRLFRSWRASANYELLIPQRAQVRVETVSGDSEFNDIGGSVDVKTVSGRINIVAAKDGVRCKTVSGDIFLESIVGDVKIKSISGEVAIKGILGSMEAETVSGDIRVDDFTLSEEIEAESISGDISISGALSPGGNYNLDSQSGKISVAVPADANFILETNTFSGEIQCAFGLMLSGKIDPKKLQGTVGVGGANLNLSTFSGDIQIDKMHNIFAMAACFNTASPSFLCLN